MKDLCREGAIMKTFVKEHEMMAISLIGKYASSHTSVIKQDGTV
jgi:hypothetical protein